MTPPWVSIPKLGIERIPAWYARYLTYLQSPEWEAVRRKVRIRESDANGGWPACQACGVRIDESPYPLEVDHLHYNFLYREVECWSQGASQSLQLLCRECHEAKHRRRTTSGRTITPVEDR